MTNLRPYLFFILILILASNAMAQNHLSSGHSIRIVWKLDGHNQKLPQNLEEPSLTGTRVAIRKVRLFILKQFYDSGYFSGSIDSLQIHKGTITFFTQKHERYRVKSLLIRKSANSVYSQKLSNRLEQKSYLEPGDRYSKSTLEEEIQRIIRYYEDEGYPLVKVTIDHIKMNPKKSAVSIYLSVRKGRQMRVSGVIISDLKKNDPNYIAMITGIRDSTLITPNVMRNGRKNLQNSDLFISVSPGNIVDEKQHYFIQYKVQEKNTNAFDLLLGYVPNVTGKGGMIVGDGKLLIRNAIWNGSSLNISFDRLQKFVTKFQIGYQKDWLFRVPFGLGVNFHFFQQDSAYQVRNATLKASYNLNGATQIYMTLHQQAVSTNLNYTATSTAFDGSGLYAGLGISYRAVDNILVPTRGLVFSLKFETGYKHFTDQRIINDSLKTHIRQRSIRFDFQPYFNPFRRQVITFSIHGFYLDSGFYTESDLIRFGGAGSLRGYRQDQFEASRMLWGDTEYRYLLDPTTYAFIFGAAGTYMRPRLTTGTSFTLRQVQWLYSYGLGFAFQTRLGQLKFSYAKSPQVSFSNGLIHFSIKGNL